MNMLRNLRERFANRGYAGPSGEADDQALARQMRALALRTRVEGRARLQAARCVLPDLRRAEAETAALLEASPSEALSFLAEGARLMEASAEQARQKRGEPLPAWQGEPRILRVMRRLCAGGDTAVTQEHYLLAVASFDEVQALDMAELWAAPTALRLALAEAFNQAARELLRAELERLEAERWVDNHRPDGDFSGRGPAFFERALQLAQERELPELRACLEAFLSGQDESPERCVRAAHEARALERLRLGNLVDAVRMLEALDGQEAFSLLSRTEAALSEDPGDVYPAMDEESKAAVRAETGYIARRFALGETSVARQAARAAQAAQAEFGREDARATICWWLYTDAGRRALQARLAPETRPLRRMIPDPRGRGFMALTTVLTAGLWAFLIRRGGPLWLACGLPLCWGAVSALLGRLAPLFVKPKRLLKLALERVGPERRTLVVIPALLSSPERAEELCGQLETLGCLEADADIDFMLLGDFRDGPARREAEDEEIVRRARARVAALNAVAGREKYFYLHRERTLYAKEGRWMGHERKRGALMALNRLLLGEDGASMAFAAEGSACPRLMGRYAFVVTLDADTSMLPGTVRRLVGALAHPLNRLHREGAEAAGYAILQPNMELRASACANRLVRALAGAGGMDGYPVSVSSLYQDLTGRGSFGGKGVYDLAAFQAALEGTLPENSVLSHDLLEGMVARAGFLNDVSLYDGFPASLSGYLQRLERWTRGDWQLLPFLCSRRAFSRPRRLDTLDRFRLLDNLLRSLFAPALLVLFLGAVWLDRSAGFALGVIFAYLTPLLALPRTDREAWRGATARLAALPALAAAQLGGALRALWRRYVSGARLLDWVTAADAEHARRTNAGVTARAAAILLLPGLLCPAGVAPALALGTLFLTGPAWLRDLQETPLRERPALTMRQVGALSGLARDTWTFFERFVTPAERGLPPDNVQLDPPVGPARRTSPTNIGLYLLACLSAWVLGFIREDELKRRLSETLGTLEALEKWRGQLYNWYDIDTLRPLTPRYVSAVDSGNLAACLLLTAKAMEEDAPLAARLRALARAMDFTALYDGKRKLFFIGMDVENGRMSAAHYDLLASEARILSYVAMMLGQVPPEHWRRLGRPTLPVGRGQALVSWSGTLFEYLTPELLMRAPAGTLLAESNRAVTAAQRSAGRAKGRPWGVSESGYYAFDLRLNYQYQAFGLQALALGGTSRREVVAPYASLLALAVAPGAAADNALAMRALGWADDCGFYEAADYSAGEGGQPRLVKSHMAHHQGMALAALCNALTDGALAECFESIPEARALSLLLEEKPGTRLRLRPRPRPPRTREGLGQRLPEARCGRWARPEGRLVDTHTLFGGGATVQLTARGDLSYARDGILSNRFEGDFLGRREGVFLHVRGENGPDRVFGDPGTAVWFEAGLARYELRVEDVALRLTVSVSPEDGTLFQHIEAQNEGVRRTRLVFADCFSVALVPAADMRAHPAFQKLFVESARAGRRALSFRRRPRNPGETCPTLTHLVSGGELLDWETDLTRLAGRGDGLHAPLDPEIPFSGFLGEALDPCSALRAALDLEAGERRSLHFAVGLVEPGETGPWLERNLRDSAPERARQLGQTQARALLAFTGLTAEQHNLLQRAGAFLTDGRLRPHGEAAPEAAEKKALWALGLSGDLPILCLRLSGAGQLDRAREAIRIHEFYRAMGVWTDLVLVCEGGSDYAQPLRDRLRELIAASHLRDLNGVPGGVWLLAGETLGPREALLERASALCFRGETGLFDQLREALRALDVPAGRPYAILPPTPLPDKRRKPANGFGDFSPDGSAYEIRIGPGRDTPAPWSNVLANDTFGALLTERGGGFIWHANSLTGRVTPFANDALREGWGLMLYLADEARREAFPLLPGPVTERDFAVVHGDGFSRWESAAGELRFSVELYVPQDEDALCGEIALHNVGTEVREWVLTAFADWLLGADIADARRLRAWHAEGACFATGSMPGACYLAFPGEAAWAGLDRSAFLGHGGLARPDGLMAEGGDGHALRVRLTLPAGGTRRLRLRLGWAVDCEAARRQARLPVPPREESRHVGPVYETPDAALNHMLNHFLPRQVLSARVRARAGLYQAGGAYGFRDQLQDMLALLPYDPARVRAHLLTCAGRQFAAGDVLHWWHMPYAGVRTRVSDDLLFLPYVCAWYVLETGDAAALAEEIPFLADAPIPEGREDLYAEMRPSEERATLHEHCMRAFRRAARTGAHGLALMGGGDWNDGMNRVGAKGAGESVWLSQFLSACAARYAEIAPSEADRAWLTALSAQMNAAVEEFGWDGHWYLRAYGDDGTKLGSAEGRECRIDLISQAWAALAGLDPARCAEALDSAWRLLADEEAGIIRLLAPPFAGDGADPGYIRGYPPGVRENGGQYTHAACWFLLALARQGEEARAHKALRMLLPPDHARTEEAARRYRVEPYVMAGDVYGEPPWRGRGGWTWYTGAAGWMLRAVQELLGWERREDRARLNALLGDWPEAAVTIPYGNSAYRLVCRREAAEITLDGVKVDGDFIRMVDDGRAHEAVFPPRKAKRAGIRSDSAARTAPAESEQ